MTDKQASPEVAALETWMEQRGLTLPDFAKELGMSYDGVYQSLRWRGRVSTGIKLRFIEAFGMDEARTIFNGSTPEQVQA